MNSKIHSAVIFGIKGTPICIEATVTNGLPNFYIVGLPSKSILESKERIKSALNTIGYDYPLGHVTVNLSPANVNKNGSHLDLPIAISVLSTQMIVNHTKAKDIAIFGELSLDGSIMPVDGILPMVISLKAKGIKRVIVPRANLSETLLLEDIEVIGVSHIIEAVKIINTGSSYESLKHDTEHSISKFIIEQQEYNDIDFSDISGQENAKRAIQIAVAGHHNLLMVGTPGCGKSMLAKRIPTIMPNLTKAEIIETMIIYSASGRLNEYNSKVAGRPFRSPHNSITKAALLGGGIYPLPGEISLAHNGILFLDELNEFSQSAIEALRVPLENKYITIARGNTCYEFPCDFLLIAASNPCPCGYLGSVTKECNCTAIEVDKYRRKLSGPILDRIDLQLNMHEISYSELEADNANNLSSDDMKMNIENAINFSISQGRGRNCGNIPDKGIRASCEFGKKEKSFLESAYIKLNLTPRSYMKIMKIARTIADFDNSNVVNCSHIAEALSYRCSNFDNGDW